MIFSKLEYYLLSANFLWKLHSALEVWHSIFQTVTEHMMAMQKRANTIINNWKQTNAQNSYNNIEVFNAIKAYSAIKNR